MSLDNANVISGLDESLPRADDPTNEGDDHIRTIKHVLKNQWPGAGGLGLNAVIDATEEELNWLVGLTASVQEQLDALDSRTENLEGNLIAPVGTIMVFHDPAPPPGWVLEFINDRMLRAIYPWDPDDVYGGTDSPILNDKVSTHNHTMDVEGDHTHNFVTGLTPHALSSPSTTTGLTREHGDPNSSVSTPHTTSAGGHFHTISDNAGGDDWEPRYVNVIFAEYNP